MLSARIRPSESRQSCTSTVLRITVPSESVCSRTVVCVAENGKPFTAPMPAAPGITAETTAEIAGEAVLSTETGAA
jgi:hypothetical protein